MKITTHRCDLCGAKRHPSTMATLTVPLSDDQKKRRSETPDELHRMYERMVLGRHASPTYTTHDICMECVEGLLKSRFREIRRMILEREDR